jgi:hypothetical protein
MNVKLKTITEHSWLVLGDTDDLRIGLLTEIRDRYVLMLRGEKRQFLNKKEVNKYFENDVFSNVVEEKDTHTDKTYFINGYPVEFDSPHEVYVVGNKLPIYSKKPSSTVYYGAGYYCVNFPKNWVPGFCPKLKTLETYGYKGPFKTKAEMNSMLAKLRKEKKSK